MDHEGGGLRIRLLGPVTATRDGEPIELGGPRSRTLFAILALQPGSPISADRLIDELWAGEPPDGAAITLRSYISRLRSAFGDAQPIDYVGGGYALRLEPGRIDAHELERLIREADDALGRQRHRAAGRLLDVALGLWGGDPFGDLATDGTLRLEADRLRELRLHALEQRFDVRLALGAASELVKELERLVADHPYRERLWRQLMLALYRSDRQAEALAAYHRARTALDEELGIEPGEQLAALEAAILRHDVAPPEAATGRVRSSIPAPLTSFVGREAALVEVPALLRTNRLVTLTGVGGAGKTRLAIEIGRLVQGDFADGAVFVDAAAATEPSLVVPQVAAAIGLAEGPGSPIDRLSAALREGEILLILDNCEHVREAAAEMVARLLGDAEDVRVLATSREVLGVPGEQAVQVLPLEAPPPDATLDELRGAEAVRLLGARIGRAPGDLSESTLRTAARICRVLAGLPLAIELAAARTTALTLEEIASRLADRFEFLVSRRRISAARHQTLREAMDWSFDLLQADEQRLLAALSVFPGPFSLDGVAEVCLEGDADTALRQVERLVDASLVVASEDGTQMRYRLLDTVRQYAAEKLDPDAAVPLRDRLARHVRYRLERAEALLLAGEARRSFAELGDIDLEAIEDHNLRVQTALLRGRIQRYLGQIAGIVAEHERALEWADDPAVSAKLHLRIAWYEERDLRNALGHVDAALEPLGAGGASGDRAFALAHGAFLRLQLGLAADRSAVLESFDVARRADPGEWDVAPILVSWAIGMDDWSLASELLDARIGPAYSRGDANSRGHLLRRRLEVETWSGRLDVARGLADEAVEQAMSLRQDPAIATARARRALVSALTGDLDEAEREAEAAAAAAVGLGIMQIRFAAVSTVIVTRAIGGAWESVDALASATTRELDGVGDVDHTNYRFQAFHLDALVALGQLDRARDLADRLERKGALGPRPSWSGVSERGRVAIAMAEGRLDAAAAHAARALRLHAPELVPFETARTLLLAAELERRRGANAEASAHDASANAILRRIGAQRLNRIATAPA